MEEFIHEIYDCQRKETRIVAYGNAGYNYVMDYMNRNLKPEEYSLDNPDMHYEYFRTEIEDGTWQDKQKMLPVSVYKTSTGQYTDEEIDDPLDPWSNIVEIPVPQDLLWEWYLECLEFDREQCPDDEPEGGWGDATVEDMLRWIWEESTCDETDGLYYWLVAHNYKWTRLN